MKSYKDNIKQGIILVFIAWFILVIIMLVIKFCWIMNINYAELYGVKPNESDFSGAIKRSLKNGVVHVNKNFISAINNIRNKRRINYEKSYRFTSK